MGIPPADTIDLADRHPLNRLWSSQRTATVAKRDGKRRDASRIYP